jgi:hypothetical protein
MKAKIICYLVIGLLFLNILMINPILGKNLSISTEQKKDEFTNYIYETFHSEDYNTNEFITLDVNIDGYIDPIFYNTWQSTEFDGGFSRHSIVYNNYLYKLTYQFDVLEDEEDDKSWIVNQHLGILKYDIDDGSLVKQKTLILKEDLLTEYLSKPHGIAVYNNYIYILIDIGAQSGIAFYYLDALLLKFDTGLNLISDWTQCGIRSYVEWQDHGEYFSPEYLLSGSDGLYVTGNIEWKYENYDIFLIKFDENCNYIWNQTYGSNDKEFIMEDQTIMTYSNDCVYIAGYNGNGPLVLKYDKDGNLINTVNENNRLAGRLIFNKDNKIYVFSAKSASSNLALTVYNLDLQPIGETIYYDDQIESGNIHPYDITFDNDNIYVSGDLFTGEYDDEGHGIFKGFILKIDMDSLEKKWLKLVEQESYYCYISSTDDHLFLSGTLWNTRIFLIICDKDGGDGNNLLVEPRYISFDDVTVGDEQTLTFSITNQGDVSIEWAIISRPSWGTWIFSKENGDLMSGESTTISVTLNTDDLGRNKYYEDSITIESDSGDEEVLINLKTQLFKDRVKFLQVLIEKFPFLRIFLGFL